MKKLPLLILMVFMISCKNETSNKPIIKNNTELDDLKNNENDSIFTVVDEMPILLECATEESKTQCSSHKLLNYFSKNLKYESIAKENLLETTTVITFIVEKNGQISNIEYIKGNAHEFSNLDEVVRNIPLWKPGSLNGVIKRVKFQFPIRIHIR